MKLQKLSCLFTANEIWSSFWIIERIIFPESAVALRYFFQGKKTLSPTEIITYTRIDEFSRYNFVQEKRNYPKCVTF